MRFLRNEDSSSIVIRKFNTAPRDMHPTFTICLRSTHGGIFSDRYLEQGFNLDGKKYQNTLLGREKMCKSFPRVCEKNNVSPSNISNVIFEKAIIKLHNFMRFYGLEDKSNPDAFVRKWSSTENKLEGEENLPLYLSYQDSLRICFTRKTRFDFGLIYRLEWITLNSTFLVAQKALSAFLLIHHPMQTVRGFDKSVFFSPKETTANLNVFTLSQVRVLRRRPDANDPCNPKPNDDELFRKAVIKKVGCIPPYWKNGTLSDLKSIPDCAMFSQLKEMARIIDKTSSVMALYDPPCNEMTMNANTMEYKGRHGITQWLIRFKYMDEHYQEIQNKRDFGLDSLGSSIGGYIGIILGFGLLQLPDLLFQVYTLLKSKI